MGIYLNPDCTKFQKLINSDLHIDHSLLIEKTNEKINKDNCYLCVSRPRRFYRRHAQQVKQ